LLVRWCATDGEFQGGRNENRFDPNSQASVNSNRLFKEEYGRKMRIFQKSLKKFRGSQIGRILSKNAGKLREKKNHLPLFGQ
jgi:hypothetical protein